MQNREYAGLDIIERRDGRLDYDIFQVCDDRIGDHDKNRGMLVKNNFCIDVFHIFMYLSVKNL